MLQFPEFVFKPYTLVPPGDSIFLVGGAIRDSLMGRPIKDIDYAVNGNPREVAHRFADQNSGAFYVMDEERSTCRVLLEPKTKNQLIFDFAKMQGKSIEDDLTERDFTLNAMAVNLAQPDNLIDPLNGKTDIQDKFLRPVKSSSLEDDPVRTIRAVRYAVNLGLSIDKKTSDMIHLAVRELDRVSIERKRDEIFKILDGHKSGTALRLLNHYSVFSMLPLIMRKDYETSATQIQLYEDMVRICCCKVAGGIKRSFLMDTLFLQFSKFEDLLREHFFRTEPTGRTRKSLTQFGLLLEGGSNDDIYKMLTSFTLSSDEIKMASELILNRGLISQMVTSGTEITPREIFRFFKSTGKSGVDLVFQEFAIYAARVKSEFLKDYWLRLLDIGASLIDTWFTKPEVVQPKPLLNGNDLMFRFDLHPGPLLGELIEDMKEEQAAGVIHTYQDALEWVELRLLKVNEKPH